MGKRLIFNSSNPVFMIRKNSKKRAKQMRDYERIRDEFLTDHEICEACRKNPSIEVHHKKGKVGDLLTNPMFFLAVCRLCHIQIEHYPKWAKQMGYSISRLSTL